MLNAIQTLEPRRLLASTLTMYTYAGDLNLDGVIDSGDYGLIDNWVQYPGTSGWANGDFNYDGVIDSADYGIIDNTIQLEGGPLSGVTPVTPDTPPEFADTAKDDSIIVTAAALPGHINVHINGQTVGHSIFMKNFVVRGNRGNDKINIQLPDTFADCKITIHGGAGDDVIIGSMSVERVIAGDGNDTVLVNGGRDTVYAEGGDDSVRGGGSSDLLDGGEGNDTVRGDGGNDRIGGAGGIDRLRGSVGNDTISGGPSKDFIGGEPGNDDLFGDGGADALSGGENDDRLNGGAGSDNCSGDGGVDLLAGGSGVDSLFGGAGHDGCATPDDAYEQKDVDDADRAPLAGVQGEIQREWVGSGMMTSMPMHGVTDATVVVTYTYAGDMNFDGRVDEQDYGVIDNWIPFPGTSG